MDSLDLFFKKYAYKFPKGYPDLNNEQDINLLADLLEGLDINLNEMGLSRVELAKRNNINLFLDDFFSETPFNIKDGEVILDKIIIKSDSFTKEDKDKRENIIDKIRNSSGEIKVLGKYVENGDPYSGSTGKLIKTEKFGGIGGGGHGVENEKIFENIINQNIANNNGSVDIEIIDDFGKTLKVNNVLEAEHIGKKTSDKAKADVLLKSKDKNVPCSIKKDGNFRWESVVTRYNDLVKAFIDKGEKGLIPNLKLVPENDGTLRMINPETNEKYGAVYITDYPLLKDDIESMAFGSDNSVIIQKTFTESDFILENDLLKIKVTKLYFNLQDLTDEDMPVISIKRHSGKKSTKGLDFRTIPKKSQAKSGLIVKSNDIL